MPKNKTKKYFKIFFEKVLTLRKRYAKIKFVHYKWANKKVHWKVNNRSFREKTKRWFSEMKMYQKVNQKKIKKLKFIKRAWKNSKLYWEFDPGSG